MSENDEGRPLGTPRATSRQTLARCCDAANGLERIGNTLPNVLRDLAATIDPIDPLAAARFRRIARDAEAANARADEGTAA